MPIASLCQQVIPADTPLEIRLTKRISTNQSHPGTPVEAVLSAPVVIADKVLLPQGSMVYGIVDNVAHVGLGIRHETASMAIRIYEIVSPAGSAYFIAAKVAQIENSREKVDPKTGKIQGVRSTSTLSHKVSGLVGTLAFSNPVALVFTTAGSASVLKFSDPEFSLPADTELILKLTDAVPVSAPTDSTLPEVAPEDSEKDTLRKLVRDEPYRTVTDKKHIPSDITNLMFIGSHEAILRAFTAAGWLQVSSLNADSTYKTIRSITEQQAYRTAPMSTLLLEDQPPAASLAKTVDTFSARHHLRIFSTQDSWSGERVWISSSTQDIGIGFSKKTFIHQIDHNVDHERNKVVNDLLLTGCVKAINLVERSWLPKDLMNGTGEPILTDNHMAVLSMNECLDPKNVPDVKETAAVPIRTNLVVVATRQEVLSLRDMFTRDNIGVSAYGMIHGALAARHPKPPAAPIIPNTELTLPRYAIGTPVGQSDEPVLVARPATAGLSFPLETQPKAIVDKYAAPSVELGIHGGWAGYAGGNGGYAGYLFLDPADPTGNSDIDLALGNDHDAGYTIGGSVTLDSHRHFSHEITFDYNRTPFNLYFFDFSNIVDTTTTEANFAFQQSTLSTTEVGYNLLYHFRAKGKRLRPYVFAGPSLRLMHLTDAPVKKASPYFKLGLSTIGSITAAYQYGTTPPLDGGGIFQIGLQYGGGVQYRIARRWIWRADYKETLTHQPSFFAADGSDVYIPGDLPGYNFVLDGPYVDTAMRQQRITSGFSFVF